eukprot:1195223-Prorocentrum_minimum.AAC.3
MWFWGRCGWGAGALQQRCGVDGQQQQQAGPAGGGGGVLGSAGRAGVEQRAVSGGPPPCKRDREEAKSRTFQETKRDYSLLIIRLRVGLRN